MDAIEYYDLGIQSEDIICFLSNPGCVKIVGYVKSGKSCLAEILTDELSNTYQIPVKFQNAKKWLNEASDPCKSLFRQDSEIDREIIEVINRIKDSDKTPCWIIDDAEVLLAYASEQILIKISFMIQSGSLSLVLIRNRFINEHSGWFRERENLIYPGMPEIKLQALKSVLADSAARTFFHDPQMEDQIKWLVTMSGGNPGLMYDLSPLAPRIPTQKLSSVLINKAKRIGNNLRLTDPLRQTVLKAILKRILPPETFLKPATKAEVGALVVSGMIFPDYAFQKNPLCGDFWKIVTQSLPSATTVPENLCDAALELVILLQEMGLQTYFIDMLNIRVGNNEDLDLVRAFSICMYCQKKLPELVLPLQIILANHIGRIQIMRMLKSKDIYVNKTSEVTDIALKLMKVLGFR